MAIWLGQTTAEVLGDPTLVQEDVDTQSDLLTLGEFLGYVNRYAPVQIVKKDGVWTVYSLLTSQEMV